jgi:sugar-specific transcriptional regulator TrmB
MDVEIKAITKLGLSDKAAAVYKAALVLGQGSVQELAKQANLKRTTIYYTLEELLAFGALIQAGKGNKVLYEPIEPARLLILANDRMREFEAVLPALQDIKNTAHKKPNVYFLYGVPGFKELWSKVFTEKPEEFCIITNGVLFSGYINDKYLLSNIIDQKKKLKINSRQIISNLSENLKIISKDKQELRQSKLLSTKYPLNFTQIITKGFVAFSSPRYENMILVVQSPGFAQMQQSVFNALWDALP